LAELLQLFGVDPCRCPPIAESGASIEQSLFSAELASDRQSPEYLQLCAAAGAVG